jgi:hypothetical protein
MKGGQMHIVIILALLDLLIGVQVAMALGVKR